MKLLRFSFIALLFPVYSFSLFGVEDVEHETSIGAEFAYYFDDHSGYGQNGGFVSPDYNPVDAYAGFPTAPEDTDRTLGSGWGSAEFQTYLNHKITMPFLQGEDELTKDNNAVINLNLYVAPVAVYLKTSAKFTPIAFLNFEFGLRPNGINDLIISARSRFSKYCFNPTPLGTLVFLLISLIDKIPSFRKWIILP